MSWLSLPRIDEPEDIDDPAQPFDELQRSMADVALTNRLFGGTQTILHHVARLLRDVPSGTAHSHIRHSDRLGRHPARPAGLGPKAWAEPDGSRRGQPCRNAANGTAICLPASISVQADALALPFPPGSFDLALCALAFHHLGFEESAHVLTAMDQLTTRGFVVSDLRRDLPTLWGVQATMAALRVHPFTRHDAPASVRRAFTPPEYRKMVGLSGVQNVRIHAHWYFRIALVQDKNG